MNSKCELPILVVGGGIGGIAAAAGLAQLGHDVELVEQAAQFGEIGAGLQLAPNAFAALDSLGAGDRVRNAAVFSEGLQLMDARDGSRVFAIALGDRLLSRFGNPYAVIHRADLHGALLDAVMASKRVKVTHSARVIELTVRPGEAEVKLQSGGTLRGRAIIGCDGVHSVVRRNFGLPQERVSGDVIYRAAIAHERMPADLRINVVTLWAGPGCHLMHYPIRGGEMYNVVAVFQSRNREVPGVKEGSRDELLGYFDGFAPKPRQMLSQFENWKRWATSDADPVFEWGDGAATLLGDAAHPTLQYMAQGACMTLEDAVTLRDALRASDSIEAGLRLYERKRAVRAARIVLSAREMRRMMHVDGIERLVRNSMWHDLSVDRFYDNFDWLWGWKSARCLD